MPYTSEPSPYPSCTQPRKRIEFARILGVALTKNRGLLSTPVHSSGDAPRENI